jgi:hypothetical protein
MATPSRATPATAAVASLVKVSSTRATTGSASFTSTFHTPVTSTDRVISPAVKPHDPYIR